MTKFSIVLMFIAAVCMVVISVVHGAISLSDGTEFSSWYLGSTGFCLGTIAVGLSGVVDGYRTKHIDPK